MTDPDYFTLAEFRLLPDMSDTTTYTDAKVLAAAAYFTAIVTRELPYALIPQTVTETLDGSFLGALSLSASYPRALTSATVNGATVATNLLTLSPAGTLRYLDGVTRWDGTLIANVVVTYTAGEYATCPADVKDAVMWATRDRLIAQSASSGSWDRKSSETSDFGTVNYVLAGEKRPTGYPDLDAVIAGRLRAEPPGVA